MRNSVTINNLDIINNQRINTFVNFGGSSVELAKSNPVLKVLINENCENFTKYLERLDLPKDTNLVVLSSLHHYYYDAEEMTNVKTVINLKELNQIKQLKDFLHSISYYKRNSDAIENGVVSSSPFLNMIFNMIDSKTNKYMSERSVSLLLDEYGFKVLDMTEMDGLTYFCAQNLRTADK